MMEHRIVAAGGEDTTWTCLDECDGGNMSAKDRYIELLTNGRTPTDQDLLDWLDEELEHAEWWAEFQSEQLEKGGLS